LNAKTSNVNSVCATCGKCVLNEKHDMCALKSRNGVNTRTKMPMARPVSTREPKRTVKKSVAKPFRKTVASESTNQKPRQTTRKLYEHVSKTCSWWYPNFTPPGYNWKPKSEIGNVIPNLVEIILFIVDYGCSKHMTENLKLLINFMEKFMGTVKFGNDQIAPILGYGDLNDIVIGLPKLKFVKDHLCSSCELGKAKRNSFQSKTTPSSKRRLQLLHMDLCGPMRVESINGKKYVLVIVDDYSRYTWTYFLRSKVETPEVLIDFLRLVQRGLHAQVRIVRANKGTEFLNQPLHTYFASEGILHQTFVAQTPEQKAAEAIATACFAQNRSLVIPRHEKTPYHIINDRKQYVKFFHIFGSLCYIVIDGENLDKMKEKGDACIFVGYSTQSRAYRVFNKSTRVIVETIHVNFDELPQMASDHDHPLEQVIGNPSQSVKTRRQLESDGEMCMFALSMSQTEPKNIKESMADSAWIELMQEELHKFDRLDDCTSMYLAEAEYVSLSACCTQVLWMRTQLTDYGFHFDKIPMYCDSKAAIAISCNPVQHSRPTLPEERFKYLVRRLGMRCLTPEELEVLANESA
nr:retrovirus-related Pol polyprotein from transposon TNT 1-94 [Tanacetum cinerariifolium]